MSSKRGVNSAHMEPCRLAVAVAEGGCQTCRFKKGGRGWVNPAKTPTGPTHGKGLKPELRTMEQVIPPGATKPSVSASHPVLVLLTETPFGTVTVLSQPLCSLSHVFHCTAACL